MTPDNLIDVFQQTLMVVIVGVSAIILPGLLTGLVVALIQAMTQINEMTLSFLPKLLVILTSIILLSPWLLHSLTDFTKKLIIDIPYIIG